MLYHSNNTIWITRWNNYATSVVTWLKVYIYELSDDLNAVHWIDWWITLKKMITKYVWIQIWDKITTAEWIEFIVKKASERKSIYWKFYEVLMSCQND